VDNLMQASYIEGLAGGDQKCHKRRGFARRFVRSASLILLLAACFLPILARAPPRSVASGF
jgi:hypothetical protein